jgi:hypothetical protein
MSGTMSDARPRRTSRASSTPKSKRRALLSVVDYTFAKRALLRDFGSGIISRFDICDAHPELLRAARYMGEQSSRPCPVCDKDELKLLAYVYSDDLKANNGRVWELDKALSMAADHRGARCYVVEVCVGCSWNHLREAFVARSAG